MTQSRYLVQQGSATYHGVCLFMFDLLKRKSQELRAQLYILYRGLGDPRVGWHVKLLALLIVAYVICPLDLIPDFIPVLAGIFLILRLIPEHIRLEYLEYNEEATTDTDRFKILGMILVISIWLIVCLISYRIWSG